VVNNPAKNGTFKPAICGTFVPALTILAKIMLLNCITWLSPVFHRCCKKKEIIEMLLVNKGFAYIWLSSGLICRMYPEAQREDGR
jgi:hypothetical protein